MHQKQIKRFIADKMGVKIEMVIKMGESYYAHVGMTPQRIHPYAVAAPAQAFKDPGTKFIPFYQFALLQRFISKEPHFMTAIARAYRYFNDDMKLDAKLRAKAIVKQRFDVAQPDWGIPVSYESVEVAKRKRPELVEPEPEVPEVVQKPEEPKKKVEAPEPFHAKDEAVLKKVPKLSGKKPDVEAPQPEPNAPQPSAEAKLEEPELHKENAPDLNASFEAEFEEFMEVLEKEIENAPRPEKW